MSSFLLRLFLTYSFLETGLAANICAYLGGRQTVVGDRLYFMGGSTSYLGDTFGRNQDDNSLYWLELNASFSVEGQIEEASIQKSLGPSVPTIPGGAFLGDAAATSLYSIYGPETMDNATMSYLHTAYNLEKREWFPMDHIPGAKYNCPHPAEVSQVSAAAGGLNKSFITGYTLAEDQTNSSILLTFDASDPFRPNFTDSTGPLPPGYKPPMTYVRYGKQGVLIAVGGYQDNNQSSKWSMATIQIYDIDSEKWSQVTAKGDVPSDREGYCTAVSAAPDDSSFQMVLYGGQSTADSSEVYGDVYLLTMPAFQWIKMNDTDNRDKKRGRSGGRTLPSCLIYQERQMIVFGGSHNRSQYGCNESFSAIKLLDTTTFQWQKKFPIPNSTYEIPQPVIDVIGGGPNGGAKPASAFQNSNLELFSKTVPQYDPFLAKAISKANSSNQSTPNPPKPAAADDPKSPTGRLKNRLPQIAGGVSGGVALLLIIGSVVFFVYRKSSKNDAASYDYQKAELPTDCAPFAKTKPTSTVQEVSGDDAEVLGPGFRREMGDERDVRGELCGKWDARGELEGWVGVEAPADPGSNRATRVVYELPTRPGTRVVEDGGFF